MNTTSDSDFGLSGSSTGSSDEVDGTSFPEYNAAMMIRKVWLPCLLLLGGFGNVATILVMRRIKDHNSSQYIILMSLAVCDLCLLYTGGIREWFKTVFYLDVRLLHIVVCKIHVWLVYSTGTSSAWLVTCVTVQRTMAVLWPHRMRVMCTVRRTWIVIATLVLTAFVFHIHLLFGIEITDNGCDGAVGEYVDFFRNIYFWVDLCASSLIPFGFLLVCDVILSITLFSAASFSSMSAPAMSNVNTAQNTDCRRKVASRTTVMILVLSCTFLLLTMPVGAFLLWLVYIPTAEEEDPRSIARIELAYVVTFYLWYTNSAINFLLYCLTGVKFRKEFLNLVRCHALSAASVGKTSSAGRNNQQKQ